VRIFRNDENLVLKRLGALRRPHFGYSPGPCTRMKRVVSMAAIAAFAGKNPSTGYLLNLGHSKVFGQVFGGEVNFVLKMIMHGKTSLNLSGKYFGYFLGCPNPHGTRYHSLLISGDFFALTFLK